jgi:hypothetical protein
MGRAHKTAYTYNPSFAATPLQPVFYAEHRRPTLKGWSYMVWAEPIQPTI